ncbi:MAG: IspD/TarI family cytidylyltransferase [Erysipelotrichaceae bacterium]
MKNIGIIFAGGLGTRMGVKDVPKHFLVVDEKPIVIHTLQHFQDHELIDEIYIACTNNWIDYMQSLVDKWGITKVKGIVEGGKTGQDSIYNALVEAHRHNDDDDIVLIHDGVRPFISHDLITSNIEDTIKYGNSITCTNCNETFITSYNGKDVGSVAIRNQSFNAQAPQAFRLGEVIEAHNEMRKINPDYIDVVDNCTLFHMLNKKCYLTYGVRGNIKITNPVDIYVFKAWLDFKNSGEKVIGIPDINKEEE